MNSNGKALGILFLFQTGIGALGNSFLLSLYTISFFTGTRLKPIDLFLSHLAFVNDLVLLSKGIPQTMTILGLTNFLDDVGCKFIFYCHKVTRDLSLCTTCLLSSFQAITLSPRSLWWSKLNSRAPKYILPMILLCWTFHLLMNCMILLNVKGPNQKKNLTWQDFIYCSVAFKYSHNISIALFIISLPDILYIGLMMLTSGYMVFVLYRHHKRAQYIHGNSLTPSCSPETRATQTILLLVILFVSFNSVNSILILCIPYGISSWIPHISAFLAACFPACSSFIVIVSDSQVYKYISSLWENLMTKF